MASGFSIGSTGMKMHMIAASTSAVALLGGVVAELGPWVISGSWSYGVAAAAGVLAGLVIWVHDLMQANSKLTFIQMKKNFGDPHGPYGKGYISCSAIKRQYQELGASIDWWDCSWRAVVPLYNAGFVA